MTTPSPTTDLRDPRATGTDPGMLMDATAAQLLAKKDQELVTVERTASVLDAIAVMTDRGVGAVLVLDHGALCGIFTERDYMRRIILEERASRTTRIDEVMTAEILTVRPDTTVRACMAIMTVKRVRHLPILDAGVLHGVVSIGDCVRQIIAAKDLEIRVLRDFITRRYPG